MSRKDQMISRMPPYYHKDPLTNEIKNAEAIEFDKLDAQRKDIFLQFDPATATWGISNWEKIFGIKIDESKPLQERREMVIAKKKFNEIVTIPKIVSVASAWLGGDVDVRSDYVKFTYEITFIGKRGIPSNINDIKETLRELIPSNLGINYKFTYMTWNELDSYNWTWDQLDALGLTWDEFETYGAEKAKSYYFLSPSFISSN